MIEDQLSSKPQIHITYHIFLHVQILINATKTSIKAKLQGAYTILYSLHSSKIININIQVLKFFSYSLSLFAASFWHNICFTSRHHDPLLTLDVHVH